MSEPVALPPLHNTMGALLIGVIVSSALWGITCMQTFQYITIYWKRDSLGLRLLVSATFFFDTLHEILICHTIYMYLVVNFANPTQLGVIEWSILAEVVPSALVALLVQGFFAYRVWILSRRNKGRIYLVSLLGALVIAEFTVALIYFGKAWSLKVYSNSFKIRSLSQSMNIVGAVGDIFITASLIFFLHKSKSGMQRSNQVMNSLILFSLNTGLLTSICAFMSLIMILVYPDTFLYITFFFNLSRLYSNSLLATLNARKKLQTTIDGSGVMGTLEESSYSGSRAQRMQAPLSIQSQSGTNAPASHFISIVKQVEVMGDYEMENRGEPK
ncbi:hypothetical protein BDZ89DRAFT_1162636 [Hymenopellis radicata]|nr:hypothetical protein BDZ89DRAFT_1162636 [Hymenopellis radicata]